MNPENQLNQPHNVFPGPTDPYSTPQAPPPTPPPAPLNQPSNNYIATPKPKINFLAIFLGIIVLFLLGVFGYWYQNFYYPIAISTSTPSPTQSPTPTPDVTAGWGTYENKTEGFSFKYPTTITLKIGQRDLSYKDPTGNFQTIFSWNSLPIKTNLQDELTTRDSCPADVTTGIVPGPIPNSLRCDFVNSHYTSVDIWIQNGAKMYKAEISAFNPNVPIPQDQIDLLSQILGTLTFTVSTPTPSPTIKPTKSPTPNPNINY